MKQFSCQIDDSIQYSGKFIINYLSFNYIFLSGRTVREAPQATRRGEFPTRPSRFA